MTSQSKQRLDVFTNFQKKSEFVRSGNLDPLVSLCLKEKSKQSEISAANEFSERMISLPGWLAFFDLKLCSMRCGDEFGLEFN